MAKHGIFSVSHFAKLSRMTRDILLNYDRIGLLSPVVRRENTYRYYSSDQLAMANVVRMQLELGTPLAKIKRMKDRRTPETTAVMLGRETERMAEKMHEFENTKKLAATLHRVILAVQGLDEKSITVQSLPEEAIILGEENNYAGDRNDYDALSDFYADIGERFPEANLNYPVWAVFSEERIKNRDWRLPSRYYFYNPDGADSRPTGRYAVGYTRGGYGQTDDVYNRMLAYLEENGLELCGPAYEEYPLNEICITDDTNYLIRVLMPVRKKKGK